MRFNFFFPLVFTFSVVCVGVAHGADASTTSTSSASPFTQGIDAFQKKDLAKARANFTAALGQPSPSSQANNPAALYNLGLVESRDGKMGFAIALWRKALAHSPMFTPAREAIAWAQPKLEHTDIPHEVELWETYRKSILVYFSVHLPALFTALFLLLTGWLVLRYLGQKRTARLDEKPMPPFPIAAVLSALLLGLTLTLTISKLIDLQTIRGTIVAKKVEARSSPDVSGTPLFDLYEGLEVIVQQSSGSWVQVTYPGGATGWVPKQTVFSVLDSPKSAQADKTEAAS